MIYQFKEILNCMMCGDNTSKHKVIGRRLNRSQGFSPGKKTGITVAVCKCSRCGLVYSNPTPLPLHIDDHYNIPADEYWDNQYIKANLSGYDNLIQILKKEFNIQSGDKTLDVGAGVGKFVAALSIAGLESYGLEPSNKFAEMAYELYGLDSGRIQINAIETATYPENYFDFISLSAVIEHIFDPSDAIKKSLLWLKPGGIIKIDVPFSGWLTTRIINTIYKIKLSSFVSNLSPMHNPFHLYEFSTSSFKEHARLNNYQIIKIENIVCNTFLPRFIDPLVIPIMKFTKTGLDLCVWIRKN